VQTVERNRLTTRSFFVILIRAYPRQSAFYLVPTGRGKKAGTSETRMSRMTADCANRALK
jgi:hypothetical protein